MDLANIAFYVQDLDASIVFYRDMIGLRKIHGWDDDRSRGVIFALTPTAELELFGAPHGAAQTEPAPQHILLRFQVDDVTAEYARLVAAGVTLAEDIADQPWGDRSFVVSDPDGVGLTFFERRSELDPAGG